jgi:hypothetical protein
VSRAWLPGAQAFSWLADTTDMGVILGVLEVDSAALERLRVLTHEDWAVDMTT